MLKLPLFTLSFKRNMMNMVGGTR